MAEDIGAKITLQGEREFREALKQIESGLKVNASALTLISAKYSENSKSVEALTAKNKALEDRLSTQKEKIDKIREALTASAQKYGEADKRTMGWQASLNNAEAELISLDNELKKNNNQLDQAQKTMEKYGLKSDEVTEKTSSFGGKLNDLVNTLGINLPSGAQNAISALDKQKVSTVALLGATTALITGFGKLTIETAHTAGEIMELSSKTGLSIEKIQEFKYAAEYLEVPVETIGSTLSKMTKSMDSARTGTGEAAEAFRKLHVRVTENNGQLKDSEQVFYNVIDALGKVKNETERDSLAMQIFGKSARELNTLIDEGSTGIKSYAERAHELGYVMSDETIAKFDALDDKMTEFNKIGEATKNTLAVALLPLFSGFFDILSKIDPQILAIVATIGSILIVSLTVAKAIGDLTATFTAMSPSTLKTTAIIVGVTAALIALAAVIAVIVGKGDELNRTMNNVGNNVGRMANSVNNAGNYIGRNAKGTSNWRGGLTWVGEEGPELIDLPAGSKVYNNRESLNMARNEGKGSNQETNNFYFTVDVSQIDELQKIKNLATGVKQAGRVRAVMG